ncbi:MAG: hypothetical protein LBV57_05140 [Candidatus Symbiothrix sp.]|nr:hypothetical protein [Candidatus Symbiothrix sp.]
MLTIYTTSQKTNRLEYIAGHLFKRILGTEFQFTSDREYFAQQSGACINYSDAVLNHGLQIVPQGLLFETGIHRFEELQVSEWRGLFCFFYSGQGDIPFDLFSAALYLLCLYEEYLPKQLDKHSRFRHQDSLLFQHDCLETPVIDRWAYGLMEELQKAGYDTSDFELRQYRFVPTYDIDHPYLYRYKAWFKQLGGALRDILKGKWKKIQERVSVLVHLNEDPYMIALKQINWHQKHWQRRYFLFVLLGKKGKLGRSTAYSPKKFYKRLKTMDLAHIGMHPSYYALHNSTLLLSEKLKLETITNRRIKYSRYHFLRIQSPESFQALDSIGIKEDFSLAFAHASGFRSGTSIPYPFYDLEKDEVSRLLIRPTVMMDSTLLFHLKYTPEIALIKIKMLIDECKQYGGDYTSLWHNSNLAGSPESNPWINVFIESSEYAISQEKS